MFQKQHARIPFRVYNFSYSKKRNPFNKKRIKAYAELYNSVEV